ncbi:MAG TPA: hypothetical protein VLB86_10630 [Gaiellaceae bacterium]|nr:hypothetical protein [Gaiellaceae bacterium]
MRVAVVLLLSVAALAAAGVARASEALPDVDVRLRSLQVDAKGQALVTYTRPDGRVRHALLWGAVDARTPDPSRPQVRFRRDLSGGLARYGRLVWKRFRNVCRAYDGPALAYLAAACRAPDGSYWAVQAWVRRQPLLGFDPWRPEHTAVELHVSHWRGPLAQLEVFTNWTYGFAAQGLFGRLTYAGAPVYGFGTTKDGNPRDRYVRNVYIDTYNSAYGAGWRRESGIVTHRDTGTFCHSFVPQRPFPGYPNQDVRPAATGERYRVTVMGPGVTPIVQWEGAGLTAADRGRDGEFDATFDRVMAGDRICARER